MAVQEVLGNPPIAKRKPSQILLESQLQTITLAPQPLARGVSADLFDLPQIPGMVAKIFRRTPADLAERIDALLGNMPRNLEPSKKRVSIAWPTDRLMGAGSFKACIGYVMPRVQAARSLVDFCDLSRRLQHGVAADFGLHLRAARQLASIFRAVHIRGHRLGAINPDHVRISAEGDVSLLSLDGLQIKQGERVFPCRGENAGCLAPELQGEYVAVHLRGPEQDAFTLAVLIYRLLMLGVHPFAGPCASSAASGAVWERIAAGHWPHAARSKIPLLPEPAAPPLAVLPPRIQELFRACFEKGCREPGIRPTPAVWDSVLTEAEAELTSCAANPRHRYHQSLDACPWCARKLKNGCDPYPNVGPSAAAPVEKKRHAVIHQTPLPANSEAATAVPHTTGLKSPAVPPAAEPSAPADLANVDLSLTPEEFEPAPSPTTTASARAIEQGPSPRGWVVGLLLLALASSSFALASCQGWIHPARTAAEDELEVVASR